MSLSGPLLTTLDLIVAVGGSTPLGVADTVAYRARGRIEWDMVHHDKRLATLNLGRCYIHLMRCNLVGRIINQKQSYALDIDGIGRLVVTLKER